MHRSSINPTQFLSDLDDPRAADMARIDEVLVGAMPGRERTLWEGVFWGGTEQSIIGYGDLVQARPRGDDVEWFVIGLALQKKHISLYVNAVEDNAYIGSHYADRLGAARDGQRAKVKIGAASIGFTSADRIDLDVLRELAEHAHRISPPDR